MIQSLELLLVSKRNKYSSTKIFFKLFVVGCFHCEVHLVEKKNIWACKPCWMTLSLTVSSAIQAAAFCFQGNSFKAGWTGVMREGENLSKRYLPASFFCFWHRDPGSNLKPSACQTSLLTVTPKRNDPVPGKAVWADRHTCANEPARLELKTKSRRYFKIS